MHVRSILWPLFGASAIAAIDQPAFSLFRQFPRMLTVLGILFVVVIGYYCQRAASVSRREHIGVALVVGGATGNLIDRLRLGYVVDYLNVLVSGYHWPFNLADSSIVVGVACLALGSIPDGGARRPE